MAIVKPCEHQKFVLPKRPAICWGHYFDNISADFENGFGLVKNMAFRAGQFYSRTLKDVMFLPYQHDTFSEQ